MAKRGFPEGKKLKSDFIPVINKLPIADHPNKLTVIPLADAHYGSQEFNEVLWHNTIRRIQDDPHCYAVLVGDLIDNGLKNSITNVYGATCSPAQQKEWLYNELRPIKAKLLGAVGGNHERRSIKEVDYDPLFDVMVRLGKEDIYRQNICFMQVKLTYLFNGTEKQRHAFNFAITHGSGGGQYIGSQANRVQNYGTAIDGIDCLITGHTHKPVSFPVAKLLFYNETVVRKQFVVAVASSFLDYGGYPVQKMMVPAAQTTTEIILEYAMSGGIQKTNIRVMQ